MDHLSIVRSMGTCYKSYPIRTSGRPDNLDTHLRTVDDGPGLNTTVVARETIQKHIRQLLLIFGPLPHHGVLHSGSALAIVPLELVVVLFPVTWCGSQVGVSLVYLVSMVVPKILHLKRVWRGLDPRLWTRLAPRVWRRLGSMAWRLLLQARLEWTCPNLFFIPVLLQGARWGLLVLPLKQLLLGGGARKLR